MAAVRMRHPKSDVVQHASQAAFERVWSKQGWVLEPDAEEKPAPAKPQAKTESKAASGDKPKRGH